MAVDDVYGTVLRGSLLGVRVVNSWDYVETASSSATLSIEETINAHVQAVIIPKYRAMVSELWVPQCVETKLLAPTSGNVFIKQLGVPFKGQKTTEPLPPNAVACGSEYSTLYTRSGRGRHYFSGMTVVDEGDNCWTVSAFTELEELTDAIASNVTGLLTGTIKRCIYAGTPPFPAPLLQSRGQPQVRSLRRRTMKFC